MKTIKELRYNPLKNLSSTNLYFSTIKNLPNKKLDLDVYLPSRKVNLQRELVWTLQQKRELINSIFVGRPIPHISLMSLIDSKDSSNDDILQVIDGKQRISTMLEFYNNTFTVILEGSEYYFKDLPEEYQNAYKNYTIFCQMSYEDYNVRFTDEDKIDWFKRINFLGTPQDVEHLQRIS